MGRFLAVLLLLAGAAAAPAEAPVIEGPDGSLVLAVVGSEKSPSAVHGERVMVADPRTGATRARLLPGGTLCHGELLVLGDRVVFSGYRGRRAVALSLPTALAGRPRSLGEADTVTPSARPGRIWLGRWSIGHKRARVTLSEIALGGGDATHADGRLPRWSSLYGALDAGFLVGSGRRLTLWDRGFDRRLRTIRDGWPIAAGRSQFAWCGPDCRSLRVWSRAGERRFAPPPGIRLRAGSGALSPDGARLGVPVTLRGAPRIAVVDLASGGWTAVPGGRLRGYEAMAWSPSGRWIYFTGRRLLAWRIGTSSAVRLPIDPAGRVLSIATSGD
jgi:hypothetical protein